MKVKTVAQQEFEHAQKSFMNTTLTLALDMRPRCYGAFISIQTATDMIDYRMNPHTYTGNCPNDEIFLQ